MRASTSFKYLYNYFQHIKQEKSFTLDGVHLSILRCIQIFSELSDNGDNSSEVQYILDQLAKLSQSLSSKKNTNSTENLLTVLISYLEDKELDSFEKIYPRIQILFSFIINNNRYPMEKDLLELEIPNMDYIFLLNLMFEYYNNGEPIFKNNEDDPNLNVISIRGREIQTVAMELFQKYGQIREDKTQTLWLPKIIVDGGYSFYNANRIATYLENRGVFISRTFFLQQDSDGSRDVSIATLERIYQIHEHTQYHFFPLNWQKSFPENKTSQARFCPRCGLPFKKQLLLFKEGLSIISCEICVDL